MLDCRSKGPRFNPLPGHEDLSQTLFKGKGSFTECIFLSVIFQQIYKINFFWSNQSETLSRYCSPTVDVQLPI